MSACTATRSNRKSFRPVRLAAALFGATAILAATVLPATAADPVRLGYRIYAGGFQVLDVDIRLNLNREDYHVEIAAATEGWIGRLLPWESLSHSTGELRDGELLPQSHRMSSTWRGEPRAVILDYDGSGHVTFSAEPPAHKDDREPVPAELTVDTLDPISAVLAALVTRPGEQVCTDTVPVFDGRRRYDMIFSPAGQIDLKPSKYSYYSGQALRCQVSPKLIAGKWRRGSWTEESSNRRPIELMLAPVVEELPPVPVRLEGDSRYGNVVIHLHSVERMPQTALTPDDRPG